MKSPFLSLLPAVLTAGLFGSSCATQDEQPGHDELAEYARWHYAELDALEAEKEHFRERTRLPQHFEVPGIGELHLRTCRLAGVPGKEFLRVEFTYVNTSGAYVSTPKVEIDVFDPATDEESSASMDLVIPIGLALGPGSTYSTWMDVMTNGLHRRDGWDWRIAISAEPIEKTAILN